MKTICFTLFGILFVASIQAQDLSNDILGSWIVTSFVGSQGPNEDELVSDFVGQSFLGDSLFINSKIFFKHVTKTLNNDPAVDEFITKNYLTSNICNFKIDKSEQIVDINNYLFQNFGLRPIQLGLDKNKDQMTIIYTKCSDKYFDKIYFISRDKILLHDTGMFYILSRCN